MILIFVIALNRQPCVWFWIANWSKSIKYTQKNYNHQVIGIKSNMILKEKLTSPCKFNVSHYFKV
jgi:hypothetical protein